MNEDQVPRLDRFRAEHPEVEISSPLETPSGLWRARRGDVLLGVRYQLRDLLDDLEELLT